MKNKLLTILLILLAAGCIILLCVGSLAAIVLGFLGITVFFSAIGAGVLDVAGVALWGLITVALASVCCFTGLVFFMDLCISALPPAHPQQDKPLACLALASVATTVILFLSTQWRCFEEVCLAADGLYVLFVILYLLIKRGKPHDSN